MMNFLNKRSKKEKVNLPVRGITLLVSIILTSVVLSVALALLDVSYKQILLASSARQSQYALYSSDSIMECALYWDQQQDAFNYTASTYLTSGITCNNLSAPIIPTSSVAGNTRTTTFSVPCAGGGTLGNATIYKTSTGATSIFGTGYSTCTLTDPRRIERGLTVTYGDFAAGSGGGSVTYLIVGGGGGGGTGAGGGGGGGQVRTGSLAVSSATTYPVVVGTGGATAPAGGVAATGVGSSAFSLTAAGGAGGTGNGPGGVSGSANAGGAAGPLASGGGGGGDGAVGQAGLLNGGGNGGSGTNSSISGSSVGYGGGGGRW